MNLPLYLEAQELAKAKNYQKGANVGLWYNKFFNRWDITGEQWVLKTMGKEKNSKQNDDTRKTDWIKTVTGGRCGDTSQLKENLERYVNLIKGCGGEVRVYRTTSRFLTGIGNKHPIESGFTWHHILGTPYLPGSSVKGVLRDWAQNWLNISAEEVNRLFGPSKNGKAAGELIVFDALPIEPVQLELEIMTPHYNEYYQDNKAQNPPADWYSPIPISYLMVAARESFIFGLAPRKGKTIDLQQAFGWLEEALVNMGAGAKTVSGYGRFQAHTSYKIAEIEQRKKPIHRKDLQNIANMSKIRTEMEEDGYTDPGLDRFMKALTIKWLDRMEDNDISEANRREIASLLADWYKNNKQKDWEKSKPRNKNYPKVQRIKKVLNIG